MTKQLEEIKRLAEKKLASWHDESKRELAQHCLNLVELVDYLLVDETDPRVIEILEARNDFL